MYVDILDQFGLRAVYPSEGFSNKWRKESQKPASETSFQEALRSDVKLASLWRKAETAGFSGRSDFKKSTTVFCN
jgi:hypothetical protein